MPPLKAHAEWTRQLDFRSDRVFVKHLSVTAAVGVDAWGRTKPQPVLITLTVSFKDHFDSAAATDRVDQSTVHYGELSKNLISAVEKRSKDTLGLDEMMGVIEAVALATVPNPKAVQALEMEICLPKASLLGTGVAIHYSKAQWAIARVMHLRDLAIPTIIGVNEHEKKMKQMLIVNVWIDPLTQHSAADHYDEVEQVVVKTIEETVFDTLESLTTKVLSMLIKHVVFRIAPGADVRIRVDKPSAVVFAAAPGVEIVRRSDRSDPFASKLWAQCGGRCPEPIPCPLEGRLDAHLQSTSSVSLGTSNPNQSKSSTSSSLPLFLVFQPGHKNIIQTMEEAIAAIDLSGALTLTSRGKVRDLYDVDDTTLLFIATDRISAYDVVLANGVPGKGALLTLLSAHWFSVLSSAIPGLRTHFLSLDLPAAVPAKLRGQLANRSMQVRKLRIFPIEAIVRGYLTGSAWKEYQSRGSVHGIAMPEGLREAQAFPGGAIYTPSTKAEAGQHDENIHPDQAKELIGSKYAGQIEQLALKLYATARDYALERGIIIADTKFEFGLDEATDEVVLVDEVLTPDSSRFWPASAYKVGSSPESFDKQYVRDYLTSRGLKGKEGVSLPEEIVVRTGEKYREAFEMLVGKNWTVAEGEER